MLVSAKGLFRIDEELGGDSYGGSDSKSPYPEEPGSLGSDSLIDSLTKSREKLGSDLTTANVVELTFTAVGEL
jgi:hypothetical protein